MMKNSASTKPELPSDANDFLAEHVELMVESFEHLLGRSIMANAIKAESLAKQLYHAPFVLLSHDTNAEPVFNYANAKGLELFELSWEELTQLPSRLSAEPINQDERAKLLAQVTAHGFIDNYEGIRISKTGKRFKIRDAVVWNLIDADGVYQGQAACFSNWTFLNV